MLAISTYVYVAISPVTTLQMEQTNKLAQVCYMNTVCCLAVLTLQQLTYWLQIHCVGTQSGHFWHFPESANGQNS